MENLAQLAPLIILSPAIGAFINFFWGARMGERASALVGQVASGLSFVVAVCLYLYLVNNNFVPAVIDPPLLDSWIRIESAGLEIAWQTRVDTLSVSMMLFVTFVGTLIHIYAAGYMHGDERFSRFFAYLNMFLTFMLILISGNNYLMMFVGWEGVGLCSYLLISFWWDKPNGVGWKNSDAGRKAFIANRVGDFGVLMAVFLMFWAFGTLDFYKPGEIVNPTAGQHHGDEPHATGDTHGEEAEDAHGAEEDAHGEDGEAAAESVMFVFAGDVPATFEGEGDGHGEDTAAHGEETAAHGEDAAHGEEAHGVTEPFLYYTDIKDGTAELNQFGVFNQVQYYVALDETEDVEFELGPIKFELETLLVIITLFMLLGATGKSAQIPLFVWLPDAMAGPTPVSALIHAATMVTAGVYMMVRSNVLFYNAELTSIIVTIVGSTTALVAGFIAIAQFDIKRVLAYSTVSQLGFMVAAVGLGAYVAAMFHMITHAFFKALLFLGSGSVIHGMEHGHHHVAHHDGHGDEHHHEDEFDPQDMRNMGGLSKQMPITYWTYLIGTLALAGIYPLAGFWSKDEILADAWIVGFEDGQLKGFIALGFLILAAGFTAFYMWRQIEMVFHGKPRTEAAAHAPESAPSMVIPLVILAFFSVFIGFINLPSGLGFPFTLGFEGSLGLHGLGNFLEHSIAKFHLPDFQPLIAITATAIGLGAIFFARSIYGGVKAINADGKDPFEADENIAPIWQMAHGRLYWDELYFAVIINPYIRIARFLANVVDWDFLHDYFHDSVITRGYKAMGELLAKPFDLGIIDGAVNGVGWVVRQVSGSMRRIQTGYVRTYAVALLLGVVLVVIVMLLPLLQQIG
ncbi:MAG: hypothetical protein D6711_05650 [Chloroflexi bacterium]|nr:MAG: hypothetical protein D6711_05650 [Chloroflexota bacterium]